MNSSDVTLASVIEGLVRRRIEALLARWALGACVRVRGVSGWYECIVKRLERTELAYAIARKASMGSSSSYCARDSLYDDITLLYSK